MSRRTIADPDMLHDYAVDNVQELPLHTKYRPKQLKDVLGQGDTVKSLEKIASSKNPGHAYLFTGPAGTGKTTLARILADRFHCDPNNILEVDAATNTISTPTGWPDKWLSSFHNSSNTPRPAAATPNH